MRRALHLVALLTLLPAAGLAQALSPGPLAKDHAQLDDDDQCNKCHQPGAGVVNALCLDCHQVLARRVRAGTGYHGRAVKGRPCAECHKDHLGRDAALTRWPGGRPENFPHGRTGFHLIGAHQDAGCRDCHTPARIVDADARALEGTYLGLPTTCVGCHGAEDPHQGTLRDQPCSGCHGQEHWRPAPGFDHAKTDFPLRGKHTDVECGECHEGAVFAQSKRTCEACHQNPHPKKTGFAPTCATCHTSGGWPKITWSRAQHRSFPLTFGHDVADCARCHGDDGNRAPTPACGGCHEDPHRGSLGARCQRCHDTQDWRHVRQDAVDHDRFAFELRGRHTDVPCVACHPNGKLKPIPHAQCLDCHRDPHGGEVGTTCEDCHVVAGFRPSTWPLAKHTGFPLEGAHAATPCAACHRPDAEGAPGPWHFARGKTDCTDCHADAHEGQFGERPCAECHRPAAWRPAAAFDHAAAWPLEGAHAEVACAHCHPDGRYTPTPDACGGCHGAPHLGQFEATPPPKACADCHAPTTWTGTFDHAPVWPLEGAHAQAECAACHRPVTLPDGRQTIRWRLGFDDCGRCHESPHRGDR